MVLRNTNGKTYNNLFRGPNLQIWRCAPQSGRGTAQLLRDGYCTDKEFGDDAQGTRRARTGRHG